MYINLITFLDILLWIFLFVNTSYLTFSLIIGYSEGYKFYWHKRLYIEISGTHIKLKIINKELIVIWQLGI